MEPQDLINDSLGVSHTGDREMGKIVLNEISTPVGRDTRIRRGEQRGEGRKRGDGARGQDRE
eukprot:5534406-Heterocapsa_arctica.AAC.1